MANFGFEVSRGNVDGVTNLAKFGRCNDNMDSGTQTDVWSGSNAAYGNVIWDAPTQARVHAIVSTSSADDDGSTGAYSVTVYGLTSWSTAETSETVTLDGTTPVNTSNSYVIIHRMVCNFGANTTAASNVGVITATAATDGTVTAYILAGEGQTMMAIYGVPSTHSIYLTGCYVTVNRAVAGSVNAKLLVNSNPDTQLPAFVEKDTWNAHSTGTTHSEKDYSQNPRKFAGPCIIKITGNSSANNMDVGAGFNGYLVEN